MDPTTEIQDENSQSETQVDPWAEAFAALDKKNQEDIASATGADGSAEGDEGSTNAGGETLPDNADVDNGSQNEGAVGGLADNANEAGAQDDQAEGDLGESGPAESVNFEEYEKTFNQNLEQQVINDVAAAFKREGKVMQYNGTLGANINHHDICKRDEDGVPRFFNPETGREFTGDNPRRQAQEWCDDYNKELAEVFNHTCVNYKEHLLKEQKPMLDLVRFEPTYDALDPMTRSLFDDLISDYELKDKQGEVIGYSIDLDKALAAVRRQISGIQNRFGKQQEPASQTPLSNQGNNGGPALDIKSAAGDAARAGERQINSIADGLLAIEEAKLAKMKEKK